MDNILSFKHFSNSEQSLGESTFRLLIKYPPEYRNEYLIEKTTVVGRGSHCDIVILDEIFSRQHFQLTPSAEGLALEDLGSTNGTVYNGMDIEKVSLKDQDEFEVGSLIFQVEIKSNAKAVFEFDPIEEEKSSSVLSSEEFRNKATSLLEHNRQAKLNSGIMSIQIQQLNELEPGSGEYNFLCFEVVHFLEKELLSDELLATWSSDTFLYFMNDLSVEQLRDFADDLEASLEMRKFSLNGEMIQLKVHVQCSINPFVSQMPLEEWLLQLQ